MKIENKLQVDVNGNLTTKDGSSVQKHLKKWMKAIKAIAPVDVNVVTHSGLNKIVGGHKKNDDSAPIWGERSVSEAAHKLRAVTLRYLPETDCNVMDITTSTHDIRILIPNIDLTELAGLDRKAAAWDGVYDTARMELFDMFLALAFREDSEVCNTEDKWFKAVEEAGDLVEHANNVRINGLSCYGK